MQDSVLIPVKTVVIKHNEPETIFPSSRPHIRGGPYANFEGVVPYDLENLSSVHITCGCYNCKKLFATLKEAIQSNLDNQAIIQKLLEMQVSQEEEILCAA